MTTVPAASEVCCPYNCGTVRAFDPSRRACKACGGWLKFCRDAGCLMPNRIFARFCRRCRAALPAWESWPCYGSNPTGSGLWRRPAPWRDQHGIRLLSAWREDVNLGAPASASCAVAAAGTLLTFTATGSLTMTDLRDGRAIDRNTLDEDPVSLYTTGERLLVVTAERVRLYSLLGRAADDYSASGPTGLRKLAEKSIPSTYRRFVGHAIPYGPHLVLAAAGASAYGLLCLKLDSLENLWEDDAQKSFPGDVAFLAPWGEAGLVVGNGDGRVVGLSGVKGSEAFQVQLPGGLYHGFARAAVHDGGLYAFNAGGDLTRTNLSGRRESELVGQVHVGNPSTLAVSGKEIVVGNRHGDFTRFNAYGLEPRTFGITARANDPSGFTVPTVLSEDGCALAATEGGTLLFFGPRSESPPLERMFGFKQGTGLSSFVLEGNTLVGLSTRGEVQALKILPEGESKE